MIAIEGFVLAGGQSRRMGQNKALLMLGDTALVDLAGGILAHIADPVSIVGSLPEYAGPLMVIDDVSLGTPRSGSMIGLYSALCNARTEWAAVLACDLPFVEPELLRRMVLRSKESMESENQTIQAVIPRQPDGRVQPLCGLYRTRSCVPVIEEMMINGDLRLQDLLNRLRTYILEVIEYTDMADAERLFFNVNTPDEFQAAAAIPRPDHS